MHSDGDVESLVKFHSPSARPTAGVCVAPPKGGLPVGGMPLRGTGGRDERTPL